MLHELLRSSARRHPERPAVADGTRIVSYAELDAWSDQVAALLLRAGVAHRDRVGICLEKSAAAFAGLYGVLKAGAAYVPLDPRGPLPRLARIAGDCRIAALLTACDRSTDWPAIVAAAVGLRAVITLDGPWPRGVSLPGRVARYGADDVANATPEPSPCPADPGDLAYVLYTSGSTGQPKGVMLSHRNAQSFVGWAAETFEVTAADRLSSHAPLHFDLSVFDLFAAAQAGAAVVLVPAGARILPRELGHFIRRSGITVWYSVPSALSLLARRGGLPPGALSGLRCVLFAGEVFPVPALRQLMALAPRARFANLYGPTETNVCTWYEVPPLPASRTTPLPIGRPIADVEVFVAGADGRLAPPGEIGELYVSGPTVMRGYWGDSQRTRRALAAVPGGRDGKLAYRTGDLAYLGQDGDYRFVGRVDHQIKCRGYRIEPGEVEAALHAHPAVAGCAVLARPDAEGANHLVAYVTIQGAVDAASLAQACAEHLPRAMVPEQFIICDALPVTSTGKVDRAALAHGTTEPALAVADAEAVAGARQRCARLTHTESDDYASAPCPGTRGPLSHGLGGLLEGGQAHGRPAAVGCRSGPRRGS
jgi:L-proline---[L-prolyl-carrier protein] ligase